MKAERRLDAYKALTLDSVPKSIDPRDYPRTIDFDLGDDTLSFLLQPREHPTDIFRYKFPPFSSDMDSLEIIRVKTPDILADAGGENYEAQIFYSDKGKLIGLEKKLGALLLAPSDDLSAADPARG